MRAFRPSRILAAPAAVVVGAAVALGDPAPWSFALVARVALAALLLQAGSRALLVRARDRVARLLPGRRGPAASGADTLLVAGLVLLGLGIWAGLDAVEARGWPLLWLGVLGVLAGIGYSHGPALRDRALGEPVAFLLFGPLPVLAGHLAATGRASAAALTISVCLGFLATAAALAASREDLARDLERRAASWATTFSAATADRLFLLLVAVPYAGLLLGVARGHYSWPVLAPLVTVPLAGRAYVAFRRTAGAGAEPSPAVDRAVALYLAFAVSVIVGWIVAVELVPRAS